MKALMKVIFLFLLGVHYNLSRLGIQVFGFHVVNYHRIPYCKSLTCGKKIYTDKLVSLDLSQTNKYNDDNIHNESGEYDDKINERNDALRIAMNNIAQSLLSKDFTSSSSSKREINLKLVSHGLNFDSHTRRLDYFSPSLSSIWKLVTQEYHSSSTTGPLLNTPFDFNDIHSSNFEQRLSFQRSSSPSSSIDLNSNKNQNRNANKDQNTAKHPESRDSNPLRFHIHLHPSHLNIVESNNNSNQHDNHHAHSLQSNIGTNTTNNHHNTSYSISYWHENKYITDTFITKESSINYLSYRSEHYLIYNTSHSSATSDNSMLFVQTSFFEPLLNRNQNEYDDEHEHSHEQSKSNSGKHTIIASYNQTFTRSYEYQLDDTLYYQPHHVLTSPLQRVQACIANVQIRTVLVPDPTNTEVLEQFYHLQIDKDHNDKEKIILKPNQYKVYIDGESDALLSRGLLSLIHHSFSQKNVTAQHVLALDPSTVTDILGLRDILSAGRNDGLQSIVLTVQKQIRTLLQRSQSDSSIATINTPSATTVTTTSSVNHPLITSSLQTPSSYSSLNANQIDSTLDESQPENEINIKTLIPEISRLSKDQKYTNERPKVAMLLSGGVDSAVAMNILVKQNYNVTAFYLKIWLEDELAHLGQCPWEDDYNTCVAVCKHAGNIPLETISLQKEYKDRVISYTIQEARKGRTPNPDIMCNSRVKFGCFYDAIEGRDFDYVASGHYACTSVDNQNDQDTPIKLLRAPDPIKDQSYFLSALTQTQLKRILFPIGNLHKSQVRLLADELDLPNKNRPDSQGLCFLGKVKFDEFLQAYLGNDPGDIIDAENGQIIGRHNGIWFHTIGQRKGIGNFLLPKASSQGPWYVVAKDPQQRLIIASNQYDEDAFSAARSEFYVEDIKWISLSSHDLKALVTYDKNLDNNKMSFRLSMKIRHGPRIVQGTLSLEDESASSGKIVLDAKDGGLAPGQYVAFYLVDSLECLGSGVISEKHWVDFLTKSRQTRIDAVN